jgi:hypothetical protein
MILDGPESLAAVLSKNSLVCSSESNPRPKFHWIELNTVDTIFDGHNLNLCDSAGYKRWKQSASDHDLKLIFQCVATRGATVVKLNYSVSVTEIGYHCLKSGKPMLLLLLCIVLEYCPAAVTIGTIHLIPARLLPQNRKKLYITFYNR